MRRMYRRGLGLGLCSRMQASSLDAFAGGSFGNALLKKGRKPLSSTARPRRKVWARQRISAFWPVAPSPTPAPP